MSTRAVIYVPPGQEHDRWLSRCLAHCEGSEYQVVAVIEVDGWRDVFRMLADGAVDVAVFGKFEHLPSAPDAPRIEEAVVEVHRPPSKRRPRPFRGRRK